MSTRIFLLGSVVTNTNTNTTTNTTITTTVEPIPTNATGAAATTTILGSSQTVANTTTTNNTSNSNTNNNGVTSTKEAAASLASVADVEARCGSVLQSCAARPWCVVVSEFQRVNDAALPTELHVVDLTPHESVVLLASVAVVADASMATLLANAKLFRPRHVVQIVGTAYDVGDVRVCIGASKSHTFVQLSSATETDVAVLDAMAAQALLADFQLLGAFAVAGSIDHDAGKLSYARAMLDACRSLLR